LIAFVLGDVVHPPLFYLLLKAWIDLGGETLLWLRFFPVLAAALAIIPFLLLCRELKLSAVETNVALILTAVNPYLVYYSQELRMYSLVLLLSLCSIWLLVKFLNSEADSKGLLLALSIANVLLVYTHYYGWLVVCIENLFLLFLNRKKLFLFSLSTAIALFAFLPWISFVRRAVVTSGGLGVNLGWNQPPNINSLIQHFSLLSGPLDFRGATYLRFLLFGCPILICLLLELRRLIAKRQGNGNRRSVTFWLLFAFSFLPV